MPTGYTEGILSGKITTFPQFAKICSRAFGATIHLRDEALDCEYTPQVVSDYHSNKINESTRIDYELSSLDANEIRKKIISDEAESIVYHSEEYQKETKRCDDANKWIDDLLTSLAK